MKPPALPNHQPASGLRQFFLGDGKHTRIAAAFGILLLCALVAIKLSDEEQTVLQDQQFPMTSLAVRTTGRLGDFTEKTLALAEDGNTLFWSGNTRHVSRLRFHATGADGASDSFGFEAPLTPLRLEYLASRDALLVAGESPGNEVFLLEASTGAILQSLAGHKVTVVSLAASQDERWAVSCDEQGTLICWDLLSGRRVNAVQLPGPAFEAVFIPDGNAILVAMTDNSISKLEVPHLKVSRNYPGFQARITSLAVSPSGAMFAAGSEDGYVKVFDVQTRTFQEFGARVYAPQVDNILTRLWEYLWKVGLRAEGQAAHLPGIYPPIHVSYSADGKTLFSVRRGDRLRLWDLESNNLLGAWPMDQKIIAFRSSANRRRAFAVLGDGRGVFFSPEDIGVVLRSSH